MSSHCIPIHSIDCTLALACRYKSFHRLKGLPRKVGSIDCDGWLDGLLYWLALLAGWLGLLLTTRRVGQDMDCFDGFTAFPLTCEMALAG